MKLHCKDVSGYQAGLDKELDRDTILISRDESADLQLHPTKDLQVGSQQHVKIVRDNASYIVHCQHDNGVTVITGGKTIELRQGEQIRFEHDADLVLGEDGPRIRCIVIDTEIPATVEQLATLAREKMPVSEVTTATVQKAEQSSGRILLVAITALVLIGGVGIGSYFAFRSADKKSDETIEALNDEIEDQAEEHETTSRNSTAQWRRVSLGWTPWTKRSSRSTLRSATTLPPCCKSDSSPSPPSGSSITMDCLHPWVRHGSLTTSC